MKYAIVIPDGCADEPQESLGGLTPLQAADRLLLLTSLQAADARPGAASAGAAGAPLASGGGEGGGSAQGARQPALRALQWRMSASSSARVRLCRPSSVEGSRPAAFHGGWLPWPRTMSSCR